MVKLTSFVTLAAIVASIAAAPIETNTTTATATSAPSTTATLNAVPTALPEDLIEDIEDVEIGIASNNPFSTSITHYGKATWFTHHYGACNYYWDGNKEPVVALSARMMGAQSWGNPFCGRHVRVVNRDQPHRVVIGRVVDKCPGDECAFGSLDLSPAAFKQLGHLDTGILNIAWNFL
ncbi:hypothetical protein CPB97_009955 [Podila verticillata]|nr:hypothetical protein CPB97_009955 [Podila verticillata]